ncbi:plant U-box 24 [Striga hermonthica]|uniref:U-box domain-containing protein n=1 Tax=Striga hermonthica TaxID=68872 RepID=A0A9N7MR51_STRHE|nr:plant U-box 24 [Striga hermonthica]
MDEIEVPQYFLCPISLQIMKDPVTTVTGITYDRDCIEKWAKTLDCAGKTLALAILKTFTEVMAGSVHLERLEPSFFAGIVKVLRGGFSPAAARSALKILVVAASAGRNRAKIVEAGAVVELVEMELAGPADKRTTELVFCLLAQLCSCADGRQQLLGHAGSVALAAKRLLRVSPAADDRILCVVDAVARFAAAPEVVAEMLRVGGVTKLCMVLQADCAAHLKKKATEILRLHSSVWRNSPCIQVYLLTWHAR